MKKVIIGFPSLAFVVIATLSIFSGFAFAIHADFNDDHIVNFADFAEFAMAWGTEEGEEDYDARCDFIYDGEINYLDVHAFSVCWLEEEDSGSIPPIPYGGKFRRVDIHGVPAPDRSPTGEGEDDRLPNMAYIDMFSLAPNYSVTDAAVPVEGGELVL
jgi:hypothetical protein